ncbi:reverse transcriptase [Gossypium australe]|uniref:Reverse transcriptase n=1 Tax=Gossypium australe TaxID=47621 RepID=A0A5B6WKF0_9ROSI|nr:reverse transcriptase [Gossypium australe]
MGEAMAQIRKVVDHLQTLTVQADVLSSKYESKPDRGRELAWLLKKVKALSIRAKPYINGKRRMDLPKQLEDQCRWLEEKFRVMENADYHCGIDANDLTLVPDLVLPPKFKTLEFEKYNGTSCPEAHITMFCRKMTGHVNNDQLLIHCFQDSLIGSAAKWYNQLSRAKINSWKDLAQAFMKQYSHVTDMTPEKITLQNIEKKQSESFKQYTQRWKQNESFKQYAQRWRNVATQVQPPLLEKETTIFFINTLKAPFINHILGSVIKSFSDIVMSGEIIENVVTSGITGHLIENCTAFKKLIERFINMGIVKFDDPSGPNVAGNPLPSHSDKGVNAIIESREKSTNMNVAELKTPLKWECIEFSALVQNLIDNKELEFFEYAKGSEGEDVCALEERGMGSTKALHITTYCKGYTLPGVLIDNGYALNLLPLSTLNMLLVDSSDMKTCENIVRAFDGTERRVMGRIEIPLLIGPNMYEVDFLVMDIKPSYNCLLGRPWIHSTGAVLSSLHQKLKLVTEGRLETINAEEDIIASVTSDVPYIGVDDEAIECSFRLLEFVNGTFIVEGNKILMPKISKTTRMGLQLTVEKRALLGGGLGKYLQGKVETPMLMDKRDHFGLGYKPDTGQKNRESEKKRIEGENLSGICPYVLGSVINNWTAEEIPVVFRANSESPDINDMSDTTTDSESLFEQDMCYSLFSFMDGSSGYNQIKMHLEDMEKTTFVTMWGTFCYKVMPFGLKNAGAMSRTKKKYVQVLMKLFLRLRKFQLKLNPAKYIFGARSGKLLGFVVSEKGIEIDLDKVKAIQELPLPRIQKKFEKAIKGSTIADFLASRALEGYEPLNFDFSNEDLMYMATTEEHSKEGHPWKLNFDGALNAVGNGIGVALISLNGDHYPFTSKLDFDCTNNIVEYEVCIMGIHAAIECKIKVLEMSIYETPAHCYNIVEEKEKDDHPWYHNVLRYVKNREYPNQATENNKRALRRLASDYVLDGEILYKRRNDQVLLRCVDAVEAKKILEEVHEGVCGTHANGFIMARQIMRFGYYWSTMEGDCISYANKCHKCQIYGDKIHVPPSHLHVMISPLPFSMWGMDVIGLISPKASNEHRFIFVVIDYFTKWVEAASHANVTNTISEVYNQFKIKHHNSSPCRQKMNGAVEAANKNIRKIVGKMTETYKDWHEKLPFSLYAYRTSVRTSIGATPFSLVYEMDAILPIEVKIPSLRVLAELKLDEAEWIQSRYD